MKVLAVFLVLAAGAAAAASECPERPLVIAHRGASGDLPEHTLAAYELALRQGADVIEPDLVMSRDGELVARHENEIGGTTNVADFPKLADRRKTRTIDGYELTGWFTEDFSLKRLRTLRSRERIPELRPANTRFDGMFPIVTFREVLRRVAAENRLRKRAEARDGMPPRPDIGVAPELKHTTYMRSRDLDPVPPLLAVLSEYGYTQKTSPVWIQSFEVGVLRELREKTKVRLLQLVAGRGGPPDGDAPSFDEMLTPTGLREIAIYADAIGVPKQRVLGEGGADLVQEAHDAGLEVHVWTFRAENHFLLPAYRRGDDPKAHGDLEGEVRAAVDRCVDAVFADHVFPAVQGRDASVAARPRRPAFTERPAR